MLDSLEYAACMQDINTWKSNIDAHMQCRLHTDIEMDAVDGLTRASSNNNI